MIVKDGPGTIGGVVDGTCTLRVFDQQTFLLILKSCWPLE